MRNFVIACIVLLAMGGSARSEDSKQLTVDLGKGVKLEMVLIPAGEFLMGSPDSDKMAASGDKPQHRVRITRPFYLGKYLVTQEQWEAVMGSNPSHFKGPKNPVEMVSWDDCQKFLAKLNAKPDPGEESSGCPARHSGNMPAVRGARRAIALGTRSRGCANMRGTVRTRASGRILWAKRSRTPGGCTTCTATCGSGARIGMMRTTMPSQRPTTRRGLSEREPRAPRRLLVLPGVVLSVGAPLQPRARDPRQRP